MFYARVPRPDPPERLPAHGKGAIGGPKLDNDAKLKRYAADPAEHHHYPGRR